MQLATARPAPRRGFTLTELLVVIAIIAVLAALVSVGVMKALDTARQTAIKTELDQIDTALKAYKDKYGEYPPCDLRSSNDAAIKRHVIRAFPRYYSINNAPKDIRDYLGADDFRPDQALVLWLGGFNPDPQRPFDTLNTLKKSQRKDALFDFDESRLTDITTLPVQQRMFGLGICPSYVAKGVKTSAPYVYFDAGYYMKVNTSGTQVFLSTPYASWDSSKLPQIGTAMCYFFDSNNNSVADITSTPPAENYVNPDSFQLIAPGIDGKFGLVNSSNTLRLYPIGVGYDVNGTDEDNVVNFVNKARLGDARP